VLRIRWVAGHGAIDGIDAKGPRGVHRIAAVSPEAAVCEMPEHHFLKSAPLAQLAFPYSVSLQQKKWESVCSAQG
jgi:hypothetical protein